MALSVIVSVPVMSAVVVGVKLTFMVQVLPGAIFALRQLLH